MNSAYALIFSICLQGDECMLSRVQEYSSLQDCMQDSIAVSVQHPEAEAVWCESMQYSSGDPE